MRVVFRRTDHKVGGVRKTGLENSGGKGIGGTPAIARQLKKEQKGDQLRNGRQKETFQ